MPHLSDSGEQRLAERELLQRLSLQVGVPLEPARLELGQGAHIAVDGFNRDHRVLCEIYAHIGLTRGGQPHKIARDILKMVAAEKRLQGQWRKILCFADEAASQCVRGNSWLALVCADFGVEIRVVSLSEDLRSAVMAAQQRQIMVNQS